MGWLFNDVGRGVEPENEHEAEDSSFGDAWEALSGTSPKRICLDVRLYIDTTDGRPAHEHLRELTGLLESRGVIVSASDALPDAPSRHGEAPDDWLEADGVAQVFVGTSTAPVMDATPPNVDTPRPEVGVRMLPVPPSGVVSAYMLSPEYEQVLSRAVFNSSGQESLNHELAYLLAMQIKRRSATGDAEALIAPPRLATLLEPHFAEHCPSVEVFGYDQIATGVQIKCVETIDLPVPPYGRLAPPAYDPPSRSELPRGPGTDEDTGASGDAMDWNW